MGIQFLKTITCSIVFFSPFEAKNRLESVFVFHYLLFVFDMSLVHEEHENNSTEDVKGLG